MVERDLANHDAELAAKVQVIPGLDVRLAYIDPEAGEDKYHVLQGLKDTTVQGDAKCCYAYERSGGTGTRGQIIVKGPMEQTKAAVHLAEVFQEKTGAAWGTLSPGDRALPGKYWLQQQATPDLKAKWQYYVSDGVDNKKTGWYPYDNSASDEVEELYAQHVANAREQRTATRLIHSGYFTYKVDLSKMSQQNTKTNKVRTIRRAVGDEVTEAPDARGRGRAASPKASPKAVGSPRAASPKASPKASPARKSPVSAVRTPMRKAKAAPMKAMKASSAMKAARISGAMKAMKASGVMKSMKRAKAMKPMKVMKPMKKPKKKSTRGKKWQVLKGTKVKSKGGLKADDLMRNKAGKVVSKKASACGKQRYKNIEKWVTSTKIARAELGLTGFVIIKKGTSFYEKIKEVMARS